ncbi:MAG: methyltransferase domain-containing protein [Spirochaetaceae bacterium]|nr:MAG: methyltransferase domain-containing protein [Spirochaetaceae bacterium]
MEQTASQQEIEGLVKQVYASVAREPHAGYHFEVGRGLADNLGYPAELFNQVPKEAVDSFAGVGYHFDFADLKPGETVLDLGSGSGMDSFIAAGLVGANGKTVGIDITPEQLDNANRLRGDRFDKIEFRHARIDDLPFEDASFDVAISNGVINLVADKQKAFEQISRVLRKGGRMAISDIVTEKQLTTDIVCDATLWASCIGGAARQTDYLKMIEAAGMQVVETRDNTQYHFLSESAKEASGEFGVKSFSLLAVKA